MKAEDQKMDEIAPEIKIETEGGVFGTKVFINGKPVEKIRKIEFLHEAGTPPIIKMEFLATDTEINAVGIVPQLPEVLKEWYVFRTKNNSKSD